MYRERVRTVGISLLGGNSGVAGPYELGIDSIRAVNEEDIPEGSAHRKYLCDYFSLSPCPMLLLDVLGAEHGSNF